MTATGSVHTILVRKQLLKHLTELAKWSSCVVSTCLYGAFHRMLLSCQFCVLDCLKQARYPTFKWQQWDSNPQSLNSQTKHKTRTWHDNNIKSNAPYSQVLTTQLNHLASLTWWFSVRLRTKWLSVRITLQSLKFQISRLFRARGSLNFRHLHSVDPLWNAYVTL